MNETNLSSIQASRQACELIFEKSVPGKRAWYLPSTTVPDASLDELTIRSLTRKSALKFPELSEPDVVRHFTNLSRRNYGVDNGFYPLGSCTMKYNPKINEDIARTLEFKRMHPLLPPEPSQDSLAVIRELETALIEIIGMNAFTLQPAAGVHGELTALLMIQEYFRDKEEFNRTKVLIPVSAHGTNPASAMMADVRRSQSVVTWRVWWI